ncbi:hypothetical protein SAMN06295987_101793 [Novosphingobium mathurense]|uniref:Uncharacterized protein n=1 Tax=Novosphingobium mathurense TaxID=428990 RepID=A0A1U6GXV5_9SPHN|nr:hypothetical protein SAMN06295987_101793 [Novosphingobium mathurense]
MLPPDRDTRQRLERAVDAEKAMHRSAAGLAIAIADLKLRHAQFAWLAPSHWPEGSPQQCEESEERHYRVAEAREELARAKMALKELECGE